MPVTQPASLAPVMTPQNETSVVEQPSSLFFDSFGIPGALDLNNWKTPVASGGAVVATVGVQQCVLGSGTTGNGYSVLESVPSFAQGSSGIAQCEMVVGLEYPVSINAYRFWGVGTHPTTPTAGAPLTNAVGFEVATTGKMYAVIYANGVRTVVQDLSSSGKQPQDFYPHLYIVYLRGDHFLFYIDNTTTAVAQTVNSQPAAPVTDTLPIKYACIAGATPPVSSVALTTIYSSVRDTGRMNYCLSDGLYPYRKATIDAYGGLRQAGCGTTPIAAGVVANTIVKPTSGVYYGIKVTGAPALGAPLVYDNATTNAGTVIDTVVTNAPTGTFSTLPLTGINCANGITVLGGATNPAMTVYWY